VNLASRLESATKQYGVPILMSEDFVALLSPTVGKFCRLVDRVVMHGTTRPLHLYTYDMPTDFFRNDSRVLMHYEPAAPEVAFASQPPGTPEAYRNKFGEAMQLYLGGPYGEQANWKQALRIFESCSEELPNDGPLKKIISFIQENATEEGKAPSTWQGWRLLADK